MIWKRSPKHGQLCYSNKSKVNSVILFTSEQKYLTKSSYYDYDIKMATKQLQIILKSQIPKVWKFYQGPNNRGPTTIIFWDEKSLH